VSQQQSPDTVSIDEIPVDIDNTQSAEVDPADVPDEIESITRGLAGEQPPTNPLVVLKAARWWYIHGKGGTDPAFQWAIEWARHLACDRYEGVIESVTHEDAGCWNCVYERQHPARGDFYRRVLQCNGDRDARVVRAS